MPAEHAHVQVNVNNIQCVTHAIRATDTCTLAVHIQTHTQRHARADMHPGTSDTRTRTRMCIRSRAHAHERNVSHRPHTFRSYCTSGTHAYARACAHTQTGMAVSLCMRVLQYQCVGAFASVDACRGVVREETYAPRVHERARPTVARIQQHVDTFSSFVSPTVCLFFPASLHQLVSLCARCSSSDSLLLTHERAIAAAVCQQHTLIYCKTRIAG